MTFKNLSINLSNPLCSCSPEEGKAPYAWAVLLGEDGPGLKIHCPKCKVELRIPNEKFRAHFNIENPNKKASPPPPPKAEKKEPKRKKLPDYLHLVKE